MGRLWVIVGAAIAVFLTFSLRDYLRESAALHEASRTVPGQVGGKPGPATSIDDKWLARELPKLNSPTPAPSPLPRVETTATMQR